MYKKSKKSSWQEFFEFSFGYCIIMLMFFSGLSIMKMFEEYKIEKNKQIQLNKEIKKQQDAMLLEQKIFQFFDDKGDLKYISTPSQNFLAMLNKQYFNNIDLTRFDYRNEIQNKLPILRDFSILNEENNEDCKNLILINKQNNIKIIGYDVYEGDYYRIFKVIVNNSFYFFVISKKLPYYSYSFDEDFEAQYEDFKNNLGKTISNIYHIKQYSCEENIKNRKYIFLKNEEKKLLSTLKN